MGKTQEIESEHFGESLSSHPDYLLMKHMHEQDLWYELLETKKENSKFVTPVLENKENITGRQKINIEENEENILRNSVGDVRT